MDWTTSNFVFLGIKTKHECITKNGTFLGFITHLRDEPTRYTATKKDPLGNTISINDFGSLEAAKNHILGLDLPKLETAVKRSVNFNPKKPIFVYIAGGKVARCADHDRLYKLMKKTEEQVKDNWASTYEETKVRRYTFSHINLTK